MREERKNQRVTPFAEAVRRLEEARTLTRRCVREAEAFAKTVAASPSTLSRGSVPGALRTLDRAVRKLAELVRAAKERFHIAVADERRLAAQHAEACAGDTSPAIASPELIAEHWTVQKAFVKEVRQAVSQLEASLAEATSNKNRLSADHNLTKASETIDRAERVVARSAAQVEEWKPPTRS